MGRAVVASGIKTSTTTLLLRIPGGRHWPQGEGGRILYKEPICRDSWRVIVAAPVILSGCVGWLVFGSIAWLPMRSFCGKRMNYLPISVPDEQGLGLGFRNSVLEVLVALLVTSYFYQRMSIYYTMPDGERGFPKAEDLHCHMCSFLVVVVEE